MESMIKRQDAECMFAACECFWRDKNARNEINDWFEREYRNFHKKVVVLDDDPTGIQTVHDIDVYTDWKKESLKQGFFSTENLFFILTNSRSFSSEKTVTVHQEIAANAVLAAKEAGVNFMLISRGDSTLRGHYPLETENLRQTLKETAGKTFHGEILCPFFKEGGRFTIDGIHYVKEKDELVPAAQTEFAKDKTFGYSHSRLSAYIAEKSKGSVREEDVVTVTLSELRGMKLDEIEERLYQLRGFRYIVVDAVEETDVKAFAIVLMRLMKRGKEYLIRSAAAVPKVFGNVSDRPLLSRKELIGDETVYGGMVLVGSHVKKTTAQLECLCQADTPMEWIEFHVDAWEKDGGLEAEAILATNKAEAAMAQGKTAVVYTSRTLIAPKEASPEEMLAISVKISDAVTSVVARLSQKPRFLIAKGGITSSDVGTRALAVKKARVLGQAQPGIPVWKTGTESKFPGMSYIIFPGNVGSEETLKLIVEKLGGKV